MRDVAGEIRIGVIGAGGRGGLARHAHNPEDGVRLVAAADPEKEVLETFKEKYDANFVTADYRELVARDDIDAVFICSPDYAHETQAIAALETGKSVYLEKPLAITIEGCDRILEAACRTKGKLCIGHNMRHMQSVLTMKRLIDEGGDWPSEGGLVPAFRRPWRRLLLQGLARGQDQIQQPAPAEGCA